MLVPGANLLSMALGLIGAQRVEWRRYVGMQTLPNGARAASWASPVPISGSLQAVDATLAQQLGLDWTKNYVQFHAPAEFHEVDRDQTGDRLSYAGRHYQVLSRTDWFHQDGWQRVLAIEVRDWTPPPAEQTVLPAVVAGASAVFAPSVTLGVPAIRPARIASTAVLYAPTVLADAPAISPPRIESSTTFGVPAVVAGAVTLQPARIAATAVLYAPTVQLIDGLVVYPSRIESTATLGVPAVAAGPVAVQPALITPTSLVRAPTIVPGDVAIAPPRIASTAVLYAPAVVLAPPAGGISYVGSAMGVDTATLPPHQAGDLLLVFAYNDNANTIPTIGPGFSTINAPTAGNSNGHRLASRIAQSNAETIGTWTNATQLVVAVYRGVDQASPIGASANLTNVSDIQYPALTLTRTDGTSWVAAISGRRTGNNPETVVPPGTVLRADTGMSGAGRVVAFDTNAGVSSWPQLATGGTNTFRYRSISVELRRATT